MTEKNTLSILENIKKKMQKFDQEPKKIETVASVSDEFEYIPSGKPKHENTSVAPSENKNVVTDIGLDEIDKEIRTTENTPIKQNEIKVEPQKVEDPALLDDLGLDDLSDLDTHTTQQTISAPSQNAMVVPTQKKEEPAVQNELDDLDELSLDHIEDEAEEKAVAPTNQTTTSTSNQKPTFEDLDLDELLKEESQTAKTPQPSSNQPNLKPQELQKNNIDDEKFLEELEKEVANKAHNTTSVAPKIEEQKKSISEELLDDIDFDDLDDLEEEMTTVPTISKPVTPNLSTSSSIEEEEKFKSPIVEENKFIPELEDLEDKDHSSFESEEEVKTKEEDSDTDENNESTANKQKLENLLQNQNFAEIAMHLLEPKLDAWLDEHLHGLVEKIVQEEVKKLFDKR